MRVLLVEDDPTDAELVQQALRRAGVAFTARRVETQDALLTALQEFGPDIVLVDFKLPHFDGASAVRVLRQQAPQVPAIMVTGTLGDDAAAELLKSGARDFVLKDRLARLGPAVRRAISEEMGIRARKAAERAVRESEVRFRRLFEAARDGILILDAASGTIVDANSAAEDMTGYPRQDLIDRKPWEVDAFRSDPAAAQAFRDSLAAPQLHRAGAHLRNGSRRIDFELMSTRYRAGEHDYVQCNLRDISDRVTAERALGESEARFRALIENSSDIFVIANGDGTIRYASPAVKTLAGFDPDGVVGQSLMAFAIPEERAAVEQSWQRILQTREVVRTERRYRAADGSMRHVDTLSQNLLHAPEVRGVVVVLRDVTERRRAEIALAESEIRFRALIESASDSVAVIDARGVVKYISPAVRAQGGYAPEELVGRNLLELVHPDDAGKAVDSLRTILSHPGAVVRAEERYRHRDGHWMHAETLSRNLLDVAPIHGIVVNLRDVTERKAMEDRLRLAQLVIERSPSVLFRWRNEPGWPVTYVSENVSQWGYSYDEFVTEGRSYASIIHPDDLEAVRKANDEQMLRGSAIALEYRIVTASGAVRWVDERSTVERDAQGTILGFQGVVLDIAERKRADEELRASRASLAEAQRIAHLGNWSLDVASGAISWSEETYRIFDRRPVDFLPTLGSVLALIHAEDRERVRAETQARMADGQPLLIDHRIVLPDGSVKYVHERALTVRNGASEAVRMVGTIQDITDRRKAQDALRDTLLRVEAQLEAVGAASQAEATAGGDLEQLARQLTELAASTAGVERANIWLFDDSGTQLHCVDAFDAVQRTHGSGQVLKESDFRNEFEALRHARYVDASDAVADPRTSGYAEGYLKPLGIVSMLDAVVQVEGRHVGLLCLEQVGRRRVWSQDEIAFACQLADKVGFALLGRRRREMEEQLRRTNVALRTLSAGNMSLVHATDEAQLYSDMCRVLVEVGGCETAWVGLVRHDAACSLELAARAGDAAAPGPDGMTWADTEAGAGPIGRAVREGRTQLVPVAADDPARRAALIALPLLRQQAVFGVLVITSGATAFGAEQLPLLEELAGDLAYGILNLRTRSAHEAQEQQLRSTMEATVYAVAGTVEMRDPYTAGHQRRVAALASAIARELGMDEERIRGLHLAATIHDVGKIIVPAEILSKPARLTTIEYEMVKQHAQAGADIVKDVQFPWPIAEMIRQHHERMDGSGYPRGLKGEAILPEARIIAVADVVESIASHRPYRAAPGVEAALAEIGSGRGTHYDAQAVDACLRLFRERHYVIPA